MRSAPMLVLFVIALSLCVLSFSETHSAPHRTAPQEAPPPERKDLRQKVEGCKKCHANVHAEWSETQHARSWSDPVFQAEIAKLEDKGESCARCHAPRSLFHTEFEEVPLGRKRDRDLGVNCITCHVLGNNYFGPFESRGHGGVEAMPEFRQAGICLSCHGQSEDRPEHDQGTSWAESDTWLKEGKSCQTCHMPLVERKLVTKESLKMKYLIGSQPVRMHSFPGARRSPAMVADCATVALSFEDDKVVAAITTHTGHGLPATTHREVVLRVTQLGADGAELSRGEKVYVFPKGPTLPPGGPTTVGFATVPGATSARATLVQIQTACEGRPKAIIQPITEAETSR